MADTLKPGEKVQWKTSQGTTSGSVKKKLTGPTDIKGHHVAASPANPEYLVESTKSGKVAAHKPDALTKVAGGEGTGGGKKTAASKTATSKAGNSKTATSKAGNSRTAKNKTAKR